MLRLSVLWRLASVGFEIAEVAPMRWVLRGVPKVLPEFDAEAFLAELQRHEAPSDPIRSAAFAVAAACRLPMEVAARSRRLAEWEVSLRVQGIGPARYRRPLDSAMFDPIFDRGEPR